MAQKDGHDASHVDSIYKEIGFMCGLEVHQRLATKEKLFCSCPANPSGADAILATVSRYQRAVAGELGDIDRSAEFEELRNRKFTYKVHDKHTCLVDIDEEPPHALNEDALMVALSLAKAMDMKVLDELQPMRKEVVDGSDPSAFQRTVLIGVDGEINVDGMAIKMPSLFLEEESSGIVSATEESIIYDTERLGIPLVEIDTDPYIPNPKAAKAVALYIGTMLRVSGIVQRGIGSIRQDVNVSIKGGARVEIKGLQEVDKLDKFVENEITRQQRLLEIKEALIKAEAKVDDAKDVTHVFKGGSVRVINNHLEKGGVVHGFRAAGFKGLLGKEVNPDRRLGSEISDYAKMAKVNGVIHSDENLNVYGFSEKEIQAIKKELNISDNDAFVIIAGRKDDVHKAVDLARERAKYALVGVPLETRGAANSELCTTRFLRPLPSGSRMYPETDAKPIMITKTLLSEASKRSPDIGKERQALAKAIENKTLVEQLIVSPRLNLYKSIIGTTKADPNFVANTIMQKFTELKRQGFEVDSIDEKRLHDLFTIYGRGDLTKNGVEELIKELSLKKDGVDDLIKVRRLQRIKGKELERLLDGIRKEAPQLDTNELRDVMMAKYRLNVDGAELNALLTRK